ncbi:hypothetical protein [uncultured Vibrio sp.]|uniref:hypothetical protein n=1 Tax=uncultured Vibrio sp. TaxID=114054 RepID=UPI0026123A08|nr:hypothetical protein [uncultured Vibrio sp.]
MALSSQSLTDTIVSELKSKGFVTQGEHAQIANLAEAIARAVVTEITQNAQVTVTKGSSAGSYKVS